MARAPRLGQARKGGQEGRPGLSQGEVAPAKRSGVRVGAECGVTPACRAPGPLSWAARDKPPRAWGFKEGDSFSPGPRGRKSKTGMCRGPRRFWGERLLESPHSPPTPPQAFPRVCPLLPLGHRSPDWAAAEPRRTSSKPLACARTLFPKKVTF